MVTIEELLIESKNEAMSKTKEDMLSEMVDAYEMILEVLKDEVNREDQISDSNIKKLLASVHMINSNLHITCVQKFGDENQVTSAIGDANCNLCEAKSKMGDC